MILRCYFKDECIANYIKIKKMPNKEILSNNKWIKIIFLIKTIYNIIYFSNKNIKCYIIIKKKYIINNVLLYFICDNFNKKDPL